MPSVKYTLSKADESALLSMVPNNLLGSGAQAQRAEIQELDDKIKEALQKKKELLRQLEPFKVKRNFQWKTLSSARGIFFSNTNVRTTAAA